MQSRQPTPTDPSPHPRPSTLAPQPKLAPAPPKDRKEAAREALLDTVLNARSLLGEMIEDFRASDRFFKFKAGVIAAWVVLSVATVFVACPSAHTGPSNSLDARVMVKRVTGLDSKITALYIENVGDAQWGDTLLKLNGIYSAAIPGVAPGRNAVVQLSKFSASDGRTPPADLKPQKLEMRSSRGNASFELGPPVD